MDAVPRLNSSNVTVEYTDPFGLFPQISPLLSEIVPLRNLHWKSSTRPVRSIDSLHVDFVPAQGTPTDQKRLSDGALRRHQIPGLRQTPYLKIYLLRCDDNDTYKSTSRKLLREWIKTKASSATSGSDCHNAFEWLIIHVIPAVVSASESTEKVSTSKWPGRGPTSVLEKVKADFNGSSKSGVDRVAQLKVPKIEGDKAQFKKSPELTSQLDDLVGKLKSGILTSFDLRVGQYEADIRGKDSQRNLPGWNFCTFFILKEGLSLGFEHVGLYEDAVIGYDELSVGLDSVLRDHISGTGDHHGGTFLSCGKDVKSQIETILSSRSAPQDVEESESRSSSEEGEDAQCSELDPVSLDTKLFPLRPDQKPYRDMILANDISVFDFRVYIFSRQLLLLLKAAGVPSKNSANGGPSTKAENQDVALLAEVCKRASEFITLGSRTLRTELENAVAGLDEKPDNAFVGDIINNFVSSWAYAAVSQVLSQTKNSTLVTPTISLSDTKELIKAAFLSSFDPESKRKLPRRTSSLMPVSPPTGESKLFSAYLGKNSRNASRTNTNALEALVPTSQSRGGAELASFRADLFCLARRQLESLGQRRGWKLEWHVLSLLFDSDSDLEDVSLSEDGSQDSNESQSTSNDQSSTATMHGVDTPHLRDALKTANRFYGLYEKITNEIFRYDIAANRMKAAERAMADIALLKYNLEDYVSAASFFHQLAAFYGYCDWKILEVTMLELHGRCLKHLNRKDEFVRTLIKILGVYSSITQAKQGSSNGWAGSTGSMLKLSDGSRLSCYIEDLLEVSRSLTGEVTVALKDFFGDINVKPMVSHYQDEDGFRVEGSLRYLLGERFDLDNVKFHLVDQSGRADSELWLENHDGVTVGAKTTKILLDSSTTIQGKFYIDRIELRADNIIFVQDFISPITATKSDIFTDGNVNKPSERVEENRPHVICFPDENALSVRVYQSNDIDLSEHRSVDVEVKSGWNEIISGSVRLKPTTAGLRILVSEARLLTTESVTLDDEVDAGRIGFASFPRESRLILRVPYTVEGAQTSLTVSVDVEYKTSARTFTFVDSFSIATALPISVNVQDLFQEEQLFSKFAISPGLQIPVRVFKCGMENSQNHVVRSSALDGEVFDIFPKQPAMVLYEIIKNNKEGQTDGGNEGEKKSLSLSIEFSSLDEECLLVLEKEFTRGLNTSNYGHLKRLLIPHLRESARSKWTSHDLEVMGLVREVEVPGYRDDVWKDITDSLEVEERKGLSQWLRKWHQENTQALPLPNEESCLKRQISIPVDVPEVQVVHTAKLQLKRDTSTMTPIGIEDAIPARLVVSHTRRWCDVENREPQPSLEFAYEIMASAENWIIGGRRRGNFTCAEGEERTFDLLLLPQRAGHLLLPTVDIRSFANSAAVPVVSSSARPASSQRRAISCEVDYRSHGETVLVTPDLQTTTINLDGFGDPSSTTAATTTISPTVPVVPPTVV